MNIPSRVNPFGYDNSLPPGYTPVDYLRSTGTQYIDTQIYNFESFILDYKSTGGSYWNNILGHIPTGRTRRFAATSGQFVAVFHPDSYYIWANFDINPSVRNRLEYSLAANRSYVVNGETYSGLSAVAVNPVYDVQEVDLSVYLFACNLGTSLSYGYAAIYECSMFDNEGVKVRDFIPVIDSAGEPCMYDKVSHNTFKNVGSGSFMVGLTLEQTRNLNLPTPTAVKKLTLVLPAEAGFDYRAQKALSDNTKKGWTLTVQYDSSGIPYNIRKVEFLEGTSAMNKSYQWINTGVQMADNVGIKAKFSVDRGRFATGVGSWAASTDSAEFLTHVSTFNIAQHHYLGYGWGIPITPSNRLLGIRAYAIQEGELNWLNSGKAVFSAPKATLYASTTSPDKDVPVSVTYTLASPPAQPVLNYEIYLFALNNNGTPYMFSTAPNRQRIYEASISVDDVEHTHFVAAIDRTGTPCMFDTIGSRLVENAGTGAFTVGIATVEELRDLYIPASPAGASLKVSVPADTPDSAIDALHTHNPNLQIAITYR